ncbi:hypothetical protein NXX40_00405 [Parabacteroides distasonis]|nr:hypothetical protein [Parabacteroides distasonis]
MKIRAIILSALILCGISAVIMYSRAAQPLQKSSVITQAINDKNTPMVIKNLILKMKEQMEVNDDQFPELIKEVENYTNSCADSASVAVLHSMLAEMYQNYFQRNQVDHQPKNPIKRLYPGGYPGMDFQLIHG